MAYSALPAKAAGDTLDLSDYNDIKGNFEAGVPDIFTTKGDLAVATAADAAARLAVGDDDSILVADSGETTGLAWQIQPACRVYNNADLDPSVGSWDGLTFNSERYDTDGMHSTSSNTGRITIPTGGDGVYSIGACVSFDTSGYTSGERILGVRLLLNGSTVIAQRRQVVGGTSPGTDTDMTISTEYELSAADYVTVQVYTSVNIDIKNAGGYSPEFWASWNRRPS